MVMFALIVSESTHGCCPTYAARTAGRASSAARALGMSTALPPPSALPPALPFAPPPLSAPLSAPPRSASISPASAIKSDVFPLPTGLPGDIVKDVRGSESNCEHDPRKCNGK